MSSKTIKISKGYDLHCHFRRPVLATAVQLTAQCYRGAVAMGNTTPAIATADDAELYKQEILSATPPDCNFLPIMTIMLTSMTTPQTIACAARRGIRILKYIPRGVSVNSLESVPMEKLHEYFPVIEAALNANMAFSVHWESLNDSKGRELCEQDREEAAIPFLDKVAKTFPRLRMVVEHATTKKMIDYVKQASLYIRATLTIHHALLTFTDVCLEPGIIYRPHSYCKPIAKKEDDRQAVVKAMVSGDRHFFFGSDLAPHPTEAKQRHPPAAGIFCPGEIATPLMVEVFLANNALKRVDDFRARFGAEFYNLPPETGSLELFRKDWNIPGEYGGIVPFLSGSPLRWKIAE